MTATKNTETLYYVLTHIRSLYTRKAKHRQQYIMTWRFDNTNIKAEVDQSHHQSTPFGDNLEELSSAHLSTTIIIIVTTP